MTFEDEVTLSVDTVVVSEEVVTLGLSRIAVWTEQTAGALGATVQPQFCISQEGGLGNLVPTDRWLNLPGTFVAVLNTPTLLNYELSPTKVRVSFTRPAGQATTFRYAILAFI